jgi:hypothetical protein
MVHLQSTITCTMPLSAYVAFYDCKSTVEEAIVRKFGFLEELAKMAAPTYRDMLNLIGGYSF